MRNERGFYDELISLLNRYSMDNFTGTPDYILANYLVDCMNKYRNTLIEREKWFGRNLNPEHPKEGEAGDDV